MKTFFRLGVVLACAAFLLAGCGGSKESADKVDAAPETEVGTEAVAAPEPDYIAVQHILIGFTGSVPGKPITRTREEAEQLAGDLFKRAKSGEDFDALVKEYTDDSHPGIYKMANFNATPDMTPPDGANKIFARAQMVAAFGDVGFPLELGGIGMAAHDPQKSKYGWHIIKRVE